MTLSTDQHNELGLVNSGKMKIDISWLVDKVIEILILIAKRSTYINDPEENPDSGSGGSNGLDDY